MKIGVCAKIKDEQKTICDWVGYYLKLGFDKITIYDDMSNPPVSETLENNGLLNNDIVEVFLYENSDTSHGQEVNYMDFCNNNKDLDWAFLCDGDEFLYTLGGDIRKFLLNFSDDTCTILVNQLIFGTSGNKKYDESTTIFEQFTKREPCNHTWSKFVKSLVRPKLIKNIKTPHIAYNKKYKVVGVYNNELNKRPINKSRGLLCEYKDENISEETPLVVFHYMTLDFESMEKKRQRNELAGHWSSDWTKVPTDNKYSLEWYDFVFSDSVLDERLYNQYGN
jgi:hypothetical protein